MKFNTYYINLEKDKFRNEHMIQELSKTNLTYKRFQGIHGAYVNKNSLVQQNIISPLCKSYCTNKIIGCGVSHIMLYKHIQEYDKNDYALILEDDVIVTNARLNYQEEIENIIKKYNREKPTWEIIKLHSMGLGIGSTAAQIINLKYIDKFASLRLHYHLDIQQFFMYHIIKMNTLFNTKDHEIVYKFPIYNMFIDNQKVGFYINNHAFQLFGLILYFYHVYWFLVLFIMFESRRMYLKRRNKIPF
jgi:GR25 family glycosyltransferase involved in LPS biosynthesis